MNKLLELSWLAERQTLKYGLMEHQNQHPRPKKKIGLFEWIAVIAVVAILFYIGQKTGCGAVKTEEKLEWIDR